MDLPKPSAAVDNSKPASSGYPTSTQSMSTAFNMLSTTTSADGPVSNQRPPPTLSGLPTELKKMIVSCAEDSCLANLRLTNKELNVISTKPFGERLLAERRFMLSKYSLEGLIGLTAHPELGK
ncbi:unnamed protein product [Aureobasidium mustum]|uniref:F-box domain-containing protein n=1 Tax=Aureobasidium mustum TaxID=2773714 RepID=A0A9N8PG54_9PEZI|nr:unnamed protein product [Aureobasidium mustum]